MVSASRRPSLKDRAWRQTLRTRPQPKALVISEAETLSSHIPHRTKAGRAKSGKQGMIFHDQGFGKSAKMAIYKTNFSPDISRRPSLHIFRLNCVPTVTKPQIDQN